MTEQPSSQPGGAERASGPRLKEVGGFEILSKVGQGGMGAVFKARQKSLDRIVALKILPPSIAQDASFIERFQREARASAKLNHVHIVQGIDVGKDEATGLWYFAMEYVDGPSLLHVLKEQKVIPEERALTIVRDIAKALECAASQGIVHRDIKPDNILLTAEGEPKLADLGLAKQLSSQDPAVTQSGQSVGTPFYMAPEQARGAADEVDARTDIYALGGTLFHLVTGSPPYSGDTAATIMAKHITEPPPKANRVNPAVSEACTRLILRMMQKKREQRVQTPRELVQQVEKILNREDSAGPLRVVRQETAGPLRVVRQDTTGPKPAVRRAEKTPAASPAAQIALGAAAVVLLGVLGAIFLRPSPPKAETAATPRNRPLPAGAQPVGAADKTEPETATPKTPPPAEVKSEPAPAQPAPVQPVAPPDPAAARESQARRLWDELRADEKSGKLPAAELRARYEQFVRDHGQTRAGREAVARLAALPALPEDNKKAVGSPAGPVVVATGPEQPAPPAVAEAREDKAAELFVRAFKETAPIAAQNRLADAAALLDRKSNAPELVEARELLGQAKADVEAVLELRRQAVEALRAMAGQTVGLKKGGAVFRGKVVDNPKAKGVTLNIGGPELTLSGEQLHPQDVDAYSPHPPQAGDDLRQRGMLFLLSGDIKAARDCLTKARDAGGGPAVEPYLDYLVVLEFGEEEAAAKKVWAAAEAWYAQNRLKEAEDAYGVFQRKHAATKTFAQSAETLKLRLAAIARSKKPEFVFVAKDSMKLYPVGHREGKFPPQESDDATAPFNNKPIYFNQRTGTDVVYEVRSPWPVRQIRWKGAAMQNMTIEILDAEGRVVTRGGPYEGGNVWAEYTVTFEPRAQFVLRFRNRVSHWYLIAELELK
jgi:tRNA A-37 threonylcarbamoyl transferase component Bud32